MRPHQTTPRPMPELPSGATRGGLVDAFEVTLAAGAAAPAAARAAVTVWMAGRVSETILTDVQLLVSELVANSVRHADAPAAALISVHAQIRADVLRLEVSDRGNQGSIVRRAPDLRFGGGFGLNVVEVLARRWGVHRNAGTQVWVELALSRPAESPEDRAMHVDNNEYTDERHDAADAAQRRADDARDRALAAREAAAQATTDYARRAHDRAAEMHTGLAVSHEDAARSLRRGGNNRQRH